MIYQIANKYYIRVAPMKYTEVKLVLKDDDVVIKTTQNRIIANSDMEIKEINFQQEKNNLKNILQDRNECEDVIPSNKRSNKYRKRS